MIESLPAGEVELIVDSQHFTRVVEQGILCAKTSLAIATADFKAMLIPGGPGVGPRSRRAPSVLRVLSKLAERGVEVRLLHAGVPSAVVLDELRPSRVKSRANKPVLPPNLVIRRCPRLHAKAVIVDCAAMYLGSANLTGAGLGAKGPHKRNFEWGVWTRATPMIDAVLGQFNALWEGAQCHKCLRREVCPVPLEEPHLAGAT